MSLIKLKPHHIGILPTWGGWTKLEIENVAKTKAFYFVKVYLTFTVFRRV